MTVTTTTAPATQRPSASARRACAGSRGAGRGSASPRPVTRGESLAVAKKEGGAIVDWLSFTFDHFMLGKGDLKHVANEMEAATGLKFYIEPSSGISGFTTGYRMYAIGFQGTSPVPVPFGVYAYGGESQKGRAYISISGAGCALIRDWKTIHSFLNHMQARITRVDLAVDFHNGEFDLDAARKAYADRYFSTGGNVPSFQDIRTSGGDTFYIGNRKNGKISRIYEKGKKEGNPDSKWTRYETELHNRDRIIPLDVILRPSDYWVGQYKINKTLIDAAAEKIKTLRKENEITIDQLTRYLRLAYGRFLHIVRLQSGDDFDAEKLFRELEMEGIPRRLEKTALHFLNKGSPPESIPKEINYAS
jgi:Putative phage replication protein RstA